MVNVKMVNKRFIFVGLLLLSMAACNAAPKLVYNGDTLAWNTEWQRKQCSRQEKSVV